MISYIKGEVESKTLEEVVLENAGIGYNIKTSTNVLNRISIGDNIKIYTYLYVREDAMQLFGFLTKEELEIFKLLINVSGVGPKSGLALLSYSSVDNLKFSILSEDIKSLSKAQGIGAKTAQRIVIELKDKLIIKDITSSNIEDTEIKKDIKSDVVLALVSLGYSNADALKSIKLVKNADKLDTESLLSEALKKIMTL